MKTPQLAQLRNAKFSFIKTQVGNLRPPTPNEHRITEFLAAGRKAFTCNMPQNNTATIPVSPTDSARRKQPQDMRKNTEVSSTGNWPILVNLNMSAVRTPARPPIANEPRKTPTNDPKALKNASVLNSLVSAVWYRFIALSEKAIDHNSRAMAPTLDPQPEWWSVVNPPLELSFIQYGFWSHLNSFVFFTHTWYAQALHKPWKESKIFNKWPKKISQFGHNDF